MHFWHYLKMQNLVVQAGTSDILLILDKMSLLSVCAHSMVKITDKQI